ncbi:helix-turn-helix transcriptional regulator [Brachyspira hyodysenteriae]|uniref:Transcriptional regulator n=2 Tax=Brachyspira hyodysenteriae TaxID=159 RepID=A0A3B6VA04_BRAHW|nr:helix-turn-helix transcriptional regulator [Brachyspira hyodysenteriae]ACN83350.1 putative transcriptional regulator [Brachyspira hyodysenteriae WA1]ANN64505.1 transcriptional regulator [Brachyspira hyodysenteriae ATCC 27164]AUJ49087.1 transcriptional regulator [Brachyspira hyodysenteriae]KLI14052.1 transcriptional regulator [Brachyspira hyodysenteriae]KLI15569.1 transcriptional regulator [Brachyspira hyodysenteriae]
MLTTNLKKPFYNNILSDSKEENNANKERLRDDDELISSVGNNIRAIRKSQTKTISEIAEMSGISAKYLQSVEVGKRNISITNLNKIANALNVPIGILFSYDHIEKTKKLLYIANKLKNYSALQLSNIDTIIKDLKNIID